MNPIAIIGVACLFPGADTPDAFWNLLKAGERATRDATAEKLGGPPAAWYDPTRTEPDTSYFLHGGYVESPDDAPFDGVPDGLSEPFRWALDVARRALADSGYLHADSLRRTGVIMGNLSLPTSASSRAFTPIYYDLFAHALNLPIEAARPGFGAEAFSPGYPAAVIARMLGLGMGGFALDAACSSSLYAVGLACAYLNSGRADMMLAGAVSAADPLFVNMGFAHLGGFPDAGKDSLPLDQRSGGLIAGEGAGMFVLKRYADAVRDGDHVYGVVRGIGLANDGAGKHILTPNSKGQILAFRRAYDAAGIDPSAVDYVECHASGTSVGDRTELASMAEAFAPSPPPIGSVKSNVGHLMTTAGMASMTKLILALQHGEIPPTINVEQPLTAAIDQPAGQVVTTAQAWPEGRPRIAGVNAFGFGGVSAHLIISDTSDLEIDESMTVTHSTQTNQKKTVRMAITGMGVHFGALDGLDAFGRALFDGETAFRDLPENRWKGLDKHPELLARFGLNSVPRGAYIESFDLDFMAMKIPPNATDEPIPQQLLLLKVADAAIRDAGLMAGGNVAVIVALGTELALHQYRARADLNWKLSDMLDSAGVALDSAAEAELRGLLKDSLLTPAQVNHYTSYIGNIAASRVASLWDFSGPAFTISAEENSVFRALEHAQMMLDAGQVEAVVIGAVDLAGSLESVLVRNSRAAIHAGEPAAGIDESSSGWMVGEGAGAIVVTRDFNAGANAYAVIDALDFAQDNAQSSGANADGLPAAPRADAIKSAMQSAYDAAGITPADVGYVELHASGIPAEDRAEIEAITALYRRPTHKPVTAIGTVKANIGHTFIASGMASLIKTALAVSHRFIPSIPNWRAPEMADFWDDTPFWAAAQSRTWFDGRRVAAVNALSADGTATHVVLSDAPESTRKPDYLRGGLPALIPISGANVDEIRRKLDALNVTAETDVIALADSAFAAYDDAAPYALALVAKNAESLLTEIERARDGLAAGGDFSTPARSTFASNPVGRSGHVAFVYPGAFNSYPRMGYELFQMFPDALDALAEVKSDLSEATAERLLYPRTLAKPDAKARRMMIEGLTGDSVAVIESGLSFALAYTRAMRDTFGVQPGAAFGYSLGEGGMMWAMGVWRDGDAGSAAFHQSRLFTERLVDPMLTIREAWGIDSTAPTDSFWAAHFIFAPVEAVKAAVERESRVYLTHINTPTECMIAGHPEACQRVLDSVGGKSMEAPFSVVIHTDAMMSEYAEFRRLHDLPVTPVDGVRFYSAADYAPVMLERPVIASAIARMACKQVDFPKLVRRAYDDGARIFIELGPRKTCAGWIEATLNDQPHVATNIDNLGMDSRRSLIHLLAELVAHRVPLKLDALYRQPSAAANGRSLVRSVRLGGADVYALIQAGLGETPLPATTPTRTPTATQSSAPLPDGLDAVHVDFLRSRREALRGMADLIQAQLESPQSAPQPAPQATPAPTVTVAPALPPIPAPNPAPAPSASSGKPLIYTHEQIDTFALRRIADTFGDRYAIYDGRRAPRIPNGDLLLISRIVAIEGERYKSGAGTSITAEYDVPVDAWYYTDSPYPTMPYSVLMEIALQPCGMLSAYHGPTFAYPDADLYFRNLDGDGTLHIDKDMRGRTIVNHVKMLSHASIGGSILQKYSFDLYDAGELFYSGTAVFGYFTSESLASRAGLDAGKSRDRWIDTERPTNVTALNPRTIGHGYLRLGDGHLDLVDEIKVVPDGGHHGKGYAYARTDIDPSMWFFKNHFHEDPVMPGSIGVETMLLAMQGFAIETGLTAEMPDGHFAHPDGGHKVAWRYRGQVLGTFKATHVEANIKEIRREAGEIVIIADASLWRENLRIYEVSDLALAIRA